MKKQILSFIMALAMVITLLPAGPVRAAESDVIEARQLVDGILEAAPHPEDYTGTAVEAQAGNLIRLGALLSGTLSSDEISSMDAYISERTQDSSSQYQSIQMFYQDYSAAQETYLDQEAEDIIRKIRDLMSKPLTREAFQTLVDQYERISYYIEDRLRSSDEGRSFYELMDLMEDADKAGERIRVIPNMIVESDYVTFSRRMDEAERAVELYHSTFTRLHSNEKFIYCLLRDRRDDLIPNIRLYNENSLKYKVEKSYHDIIETSFTTMTEDIREMFRTLAQALQAAEESEFEIPRHSFYNYDTPDSDRDIKTLIQWYDHIVRLEDRLDSLPAVPNDTISLAAVLSVYDYYINDLTETEQAMVPEEYLEKMNNGVRISTNSERVVETIDQIGAVTDEDTFSEYEERFESARDVYQTFLNQYRDVDGVDTLITNRERLNEASAVYELIKKIRRMAAEPDASMCAQLAQMRSIQLAYDDMSAEQRQQIFNIDVFNQIYADTREAQAVAEKIDRIRTNFTAMDEKLIRSIRQEYNDLSDKAKDYVGTSRYAALELVEEQLSAINRNAASQTISQIQRIGKVSAASKYTIAAARAAYNALTDTQKALVTNYQTLTEAEQDYRVLDTTVSKAKVTGVRTYTYSGKAFKPVVSVTLNGVKLIPEIDYTVSYASNVKAGTARFRVNGIGYYSGTLTKTFKIKAKKLTKAKVSGLKASYTYTGKKIKPSVTVRLGKTKLKKNRDYTIQYKSNRKRGTASYVIRGKGNYTGKISGKFRIR